MTVLAALVGYCITASVAVAVAGYVADDLGVSSRSAMWATVQAVVMFPAIVGIIALWIVVAS